MKILMINVVCGIRSTGRICTDLATALEAQGHEVKIAYGRENVPEPFQKYAVRIGTDLEVKLHGLRARLLDGSGFGSKRATERFIAWVRKYNPDIIHLHNIHGYYINVELLFQYLKICGKKIIWTLHDCWAFTGHSAFCDAVSCEKWKTGCSDCPQLKEYPKSMFDHSKYNWTKKKKLFAGVENMTIVTPSQWLAGLVKKSFLCEYPVYVIHNGIDTNQFRPLANDFKHYFHLENKYIILGVASTWNTLKGFDDFIKLRTLLDDTYAIVLVGVSKEQKKALPKGILGIERTASIKEMAQIYSAVDIFLNLTYCDTYPTVNIEALVCKTPVITYETGGSPEILSQNNGFIVKRGDIFKVAEVVKAVRDGTIKFEINIDIDKKFGKLNVLKKYANLYSPKNPGDMGFFKRKERMKLLGKRVILGMAAVWDDRKGYNDFIELSKKLDKDYKIIMVGLTKRQRSQTPENIIALAKTNYIEELRCLYSVADIFFNPTMEDNYPTTNLEAISCGTPTVTYATGGSPESALAFGGITDSNSKIYDLIHYYDLLIYKDYNFNKNKFVQEYDRVYNM